jgi:hypothetical protein
LARLAAAAWEGELAYSKQRLVLPAACWVVARTGDVDATRTLEVSTVLILLVTTNIRIDAML